MCPQCGVGADYVVVNVPFCRHCVDWVWGPEGPGTRAELEREVDKAYRARVAREATKKVQ